MKEIQGLKGRKLRWGVDSRWGVQGQSVKLGARGGHVHQNFRNGDR